MIFRNRIERHNQIIPADVSPSLDRLRMGATFIADPSRGLTVLFFDGFALFAGGCSTVRGLGLGLGFADRGSTAGGGLLGDGGRVLGWASLAVARLPVAWARACP